MQQCTNCGAEAEKNSCPTHGENVNGGSLTKRNSVFRILPIALFTLFTILVFAFLAAPVALGNSGYDLLAQPANENFFYPVSLVSLAALGGCTASIVGFVVLRDKRASNEYTYVLLVFYAIFMIITCVMFGGNYPYTEAGGILILVFSAAFAVISIAVLFAQKHSEGVNVKRKMLRLLPERLLLLFSVLVYMLPAAPVVKIGGASLSGYSSFGQYSNCVIALIVFATIALILSGIIGFCSPEDKRFFKSRLVSNIVASLIYLAVMIIAIILICKPYTVTGVDGTVTAMSSAGSGAITLLVLSILFPVLGFVGLIVECALAKRKR